MSNITINLYNFEKRRNSTLRPIDEGDVYQGELKQDFALTGLDVRFRFTNFAEVPSYNYARIESFHRYYWITEWYYESGFWRALLAVDVLASYADQIMDSVQFVTRATRSPVTKPYMIDPLAQPAGIPTREYRQIQPVDFWGAGVNTNDGLVVLGVVGSDAGSVGAVTYYAMSMPVFSSLLNTMLSSPDWLNISTSEISQGLQKAVINPCQYIVYCRWFPIHSYVFVNNGGTLGGGEIVNSINLGWWNFALANVARKLDTAGSGWVRVAKSFQVPKHPEGTGNNLFYQLSPYTSYTLEFPPFGVFEIDTTEFLGKSIMGVEVSFSVLTGDATLKVAAGDNNYIDFGKSLLVYEGQIGVQLPIAQVAGNINNFKQALAAGTITGLDAVLQEVK